MGTIGGLRAPRGLVAIVNPERFGKCLSGQGYGKSAICDCHLLAVRYENGAFNLAAVSAAAMRLICGYCL